MKKAALHNLGCKVNAYETEAMQHLLAMSTPGVLPPPLEVTLFTAKAFE